MLTLCEYLQKQHKNDSTKFFKREELDKFAFPYTEEIITTLSNRVIYGRKYVNPMTYGSISSFIEDLSPVIAICKSKIADFNKLEHDRIVDNEYKIGANKRSTFAIWIAGISALIALGALIKSFLG